MKDIEIYPSTKKQIFRILFKLGLNRDVIQFIYQLKIDIELNDNSLYHMNHLIHKTLKYNINDNLFNELSNKYIYDEYFKFCIPRINGIEWCIKYENDHNRKFLKNRIDLIFEPGFMIEKIEKEIFITKDIKWFKKFWNNEYFEQGDYVYFEPTIFRKIEVSNKLTETQILEFYEENDVYIYWEGCPRNI